MTPEPLTKGATLATLSPAGPVGDEEVRRGAAVLGREGYKVLRMPHALRRGQYLAGTDEQRASDIMDAFCDTTYDGIICTRGGYGTLRLLDKLDYDTLSRHPKPFIGFSDITALQTALYQRAGLITFTGPQLARGFGYEAKEGSLSGLDSFSHTCWFEMLEGHAWDKPLPLPEGWSLTTVCEGEAHGPLLGGNLAVLTGLCGTPWAPRFSGAIALLEEIDEPPYRVDRMLTQLHLSGAFEGMKGIVLGSFAQHVKGDRLDWATLAGELLSEKLNDVPIVRGAPYGHVGPCWTLPLGAEADLDTNAGTLLVKRGQ